MVHGGDRDDDLIEGDQLLQPRGELHVHDLSYAVFIGNKQLRGVNMTKFNLAYAQLQGADLTRAQLHGADLTSAKLQGPVPLPAARPGYEGVAAAAEPPPLPQPPRKTEHQ